MGMANPNHKINITHHVWSHREEWITYLLLTCCAYTDVFVCIRARPILAFADILVSCICQAISNKKLQDSYDKLGLRSFRNSVTSQVPLSKKCKGSRLCVYVKNKILSADMSLSDFKLWYNTSIIPG